MLFITQSYFKNMAFHLKRILYPLRQHSKIDKTKEIMEAFGVEGEEWLRTFLELPNGIPDSDTFRHVFERLSPEELSA